MPIMEAVLIILGLTLFEVISSIDNAVVNADVLATMSERWRKIFINVGLVFAVFIVRGLLPLLIIWISSPGLSLVQAFTATFSGDASIREIIERQTPILLGGGGIFLLFLFLHWLFVEDKKYSFFLERLVHKHLYFWFYALASITLLVLVWVTIRVNPLIALGLVTGSTAFFIVHGFKTQAEEQEKKLVKGHMSNLSKFLYLEVIDTTFSIDGVLGAFAFTTAVPLILIGNGLGAVVVRELTVRGIKTVQKYAYLKNGAMYSIGALGIIMLIESFGGHVKSWISPLITFVVVGIFLYLSYKELQKERLRG